MYESRMHLSRNIIIFDLFPDFMRMLQQAIEANNVCL